MSDFPPKRLEPRSEAADARERSVQVNHVTNMIAATALFGVGVLFAEPSWPVTVGVIALSGMATAASFFILRR
jgi:hypothetical protein